MNETFLSVVIPSYNETANLKRGVLNEVRDYLSKQNYSWEVLVSDDGSPETEAKELADKFCRANKNFVFIPNDHGGKAFAVYAGVVKAKGKIILFTDMDQSTPMAEIEKLLPWFDKGFDVVIGSRGEERKNSSPMRLLASKIFLTFRRFFILRKIVDTQCGFKAFRGPVVKEIFPLLQIIKTPKNIKSGWNPTAFDVELMVAAESRGYKILEVPTMWEDRDISTGKSRGSSKFIKESIAMLKEIVRVRLNDYRGLYVRPT